MRIPRFPEERPERGAVRRQCRDQATWLGLDKKIKVGMVSGKRKAKKGVIPMSGKSPKSGAAKKAGKSILEKRAEKRAKSEHNELNFVKPRKNQR
ncbi:hypothetical protein [Pseudarthrobacter sp. C4D7]|uniref:hypothetical protein n=1 Tax=Pseudarthrobacter sp. C4D7 TaxID=2735268 RepID=UPI00158481D3|nr:hypothetical protein [Pseudarthrobacter sp. C4D7]NUT72433.1 hypothetical protein [Pseudarthrobacter sp. C4D7]